MRNQDGVSCISGDHVVISLRMLTGCMFPVDTGTSRPPSGSSFQDVEDQGVTLKRLLIENIKKNIKKVYMKQDIKPIFFKKRIGV